MSNGPIILNVHMEAVTGREQELEDALLALVAPTRSESGCLAYHLHRDPERPGRFMFYEKFKDQTALDLHTSSPHFKKFLSYRAAKADPVAVANVTRWLAIA